jgi:hypothetical protein
LELASQKENIYFHRFWRDGKNATERWNALNNLNNSSLVALYGLARDLSEHSAGEWSHLRNYRNLFEHELCLIRADSASSDLPPWLVNPTPCVTSSTMRADAADMLRFTRAAVFYFAFFVRSESLTHHDSGDARTLTFDKKVIGKN